MKVFCLGAAGYVGGSIAARLLQEGHQVIGLVRTADKADALRRRGIEPVVGTLDDKALLIKAASATDAVINAASTDHPGVKVILDALAGSGKALIHTSGTGGVSTFTEGEVVEDIYEDDTPFIPIPERAARVAFNEAILAGKDAGVRTIVILPSLIYGLGSGLNPHSIQVPWLIDLAKKSGVARYIGAGRNIWSNVHIDDLVSLYVLALHEAPAGARYYAENGENSMLEICEAISRMLGFGGKTQSMTFEQASAVWGAASANGVMGSNSRVRAVRARDELGWTPSAPSLMQELETGCYPRTMR